ncbi:MAG: NADP-dependent oxidoreductase [Burkholderiales bacterium]
MKNESIRFAKHPDGLPDASCFEFTQEQVIRPAHGEVLIENHLLSVDPYIRMRMEREDSYAPAMRLGDVIVGRTVGRIIESKDSQYALGSWVVGRHAWQRYSLARADDLQAIDPELAPLSAYLGALGSTGQTAWLGLHLLGQPKPGEAVLVSAAAGAVGSVAIQLAKGYGCKTIGIAGGSSKCDWVRTKLGAYDCLDYRASDFESVLSERLNEGVDFYFDNVAGSILDQVLPKMKLHGRIALCGLISQYNAKTVDGIFNLRSLFNKRVRLEGFLLSDHKSLLPTANSDLMTAYQAGKLHHEASIYDGLDQAPTAFVDMLKGRSLGKQLVRLRTDAGCPL